MASDGDNVDLTAQLRAIERGEAAPWTQYSPAPWWSDIVFATNCAFLVIVTRLLEGPAYFVAFTCLMISVAILSFRNSGRRGPQGSGLMPPEFWRSTLLYLLGGVAAFASVYAIAQGIGIWPSVATAFVFGWALGAWYERMNARAATRAGQAACATHRIALRWLLAEDSSGPRRPLA